ncbi:MAG: hypothetical protein M1419_05000 [Bacteroidetes bacterium]|nr:hypothetical protein [Bacteroidota bacterium]
MENLIQRKPDFIYRGDKPVAVIPDINDYNEILERLDNEDDIEYLRIVRENPLQFRSFNEYIKSKNK